jgi:hypothetical protein
VPAVSFDPTNNATNRFVFMGCLPVEPDAR